MKTTSGSIYFTVTLQERKKKAKYLEFQWKPLQGRTREKVDLALSVSAGLWRRSQDLCHVPLKQTELISASLSLTCGLSFFFIRTVCLSNCTFEDSTSPAWCPSLLTLHGWTRSSTQRSGSELVLIALLCLQTMPLVFESPTLKLRRTE